jgi:hypothetical protein
MTPEQALHRLPELVQGVQRQADSLRAECERARTHWDGLGRAGGQRSDHAAALLATVRAEVGSLRSYLERVLAQLDRLIADPFGDNKEGR